jgi:hypothetical protein
LHGGVALAAAARHADLVDSHVGTLFGALLAIAQGVMPIPPGWRGRRARGCARR